MDGMVLLWNELHPSCPGRRSPGKLRQGWSSYENIPFITAGSSFIIFRVSGGPWRDSRTPQSSLPIALVNSVESNGYHLPTTDDDWSGISYPDVFHSIVSRSDGAHT